MASTIEQCAHRAEGSCWRRTLPGIRRVGAATLAVALATSACAGRSEGDESAVTAVSSATSAPVASGLASSPAVNDATLRPPATSPVEAVREFVAAEVARDHQRSFSLLAAPDRAEAGSPAGWRAAHKVMPTLRSVEPSEMTLEKTDRAVVGGGVSFEPRLDEVLGLVPAYADARWSVVAEDGGWRVAWSDSTFSGRFPAPEDPASDEAARRAVADWVRARQACTTGGVPGEYAGGLLGSTGLAARLCRSSGAVQTEKVGPLAGPQRATVIAAFGPEADKWARSLDVRAPVALRAVLAPVGSTWVVLGVFPPAPTSAGR